jgi:hypothetical protein
MQLHRRTIGAGDSGLDGMLLASYFRHFACSGGARRFIRAKLAPRHMRRAIVVAAMAAAIRSQGVFGL